MSGQPTRNDPAPQDAVRQQSLAFLGFPDYLVGDDGSVWRVPRPGGRLKALKPAVGRYGRPRVKLCRQHATKRFHVHQLVLLAFVGPCPDGMECRHFPDRNPANNRLANLQWASRLENQRDRKLHGTDSAGERNGRAKLSEADVREIRALYAAGRYSLAGLARARGVTKQTIWDAVRGETWKGVLP